MRKVIVPIIALILIMLILTFYKFPKEIHVTRSAVQFIENQSESAKQTSVKIDGHLYRPYFGKTTFEGTVVIDSMPFSKHDTMLEMVVSNENNNIYQGNLTYQSNQAPYMISNQGLIWVDKDFKNINIWGSEQWLDEGDSTNPLYIVAPASHLDEAVNVQSQMRSSFGEDFVPKL
ncbi:hypothetical protein ACE3MZ_13860 [Paenibacillus sp. WLX1005]|uniref:hypothetical protein n=1 Tax=Paenibacillus sp. WLX1005 TaxID=3243766 RepID=UPI003983E2BD